MIVAITIISSFILKFTFDTLSYIFNKNIDHQFKLVIVTINDMCTKLSNLLLC